MQFHAIAQQTHELKGRITSKNGEPAAFVTVQLRSLNLGAVSDEQGRFSIAGVPGGRYILSVQGVGYDSANTSVSVPGPVVNIRLSTNSIELHTAVVTDVSVNTKLNESPMPVRSIDVKPLQARTISVNEILAQSSGVRIQQDGGLGSVTNTSILGLGGKGVQYFVDGMPLLLQGFNLSKTVNNIPTARIDRIEIYKGIVPVQFGADVIGGVINIVTNPGLRSYIDVSTERSSFNTWRNYAGGRYVDEKTGFYAGGQVEQNYSDNNYKVNVAVTNKDFNEDSIIARRFHDRYRQYAVQGELGIRDRKWAKLLSYSQSYNYADKQIQNRFQDLKRTIGDAFITEKGLSSELQYVSDSLIRRRVVAQLYLRHSEFENNLVDTSKNVYNWLGEVSPNKKPGLGGELGFSAFNSIINTHSTVARPVVAVKLLRNHRLVFSATRTSGKRFGKDTTAAIFYTQDPFANTQKFIKLVAGASYEGEFWKNRISNISTFRYFEIKGSGDNALFFRPSPQEFGTSFRGWSQALRVAIWPKHVMIKAGMEDMARLPDEYELFGDGIFFYANPDLKPEINRGYFVGGSFDWTKKFLFNAEVTHNERNVRNLIQPVIGPNFGQYRNIARAYIRSTEFEFKLVPVKWLILDYNLTRIITLDRSDTITDEQKLKYNTQVSNRPVYFYTSRVTFRAAEVITGGDAVQVFWEGLYNRWYNLASVSNGLQSAKQVIPTQYVMNVGVNYSLRNAKTSVGFEIHNLENINRFDNFGLQNPGRSYHLKLRYLFDFSSKPTTQIP